MFKVSKVSRMCPKPCNNLHRYEEMLETYVHVYVTSRVCFFFTYEFIKYLSISIDVGMYVLRYYIFKDSSVKLYVYCYAILQ